MGATQYYVDVVADLEQEWDGEELRDPKRQWSCFMVRVAKQCPTCGHTDDEDSDVMGGVWLSADKQGDRYLRSIIRQMVGKGPRWADIHISSDR